MPQSQAPAGPVREIDSIWIPLSDGTRLSARVWLPRDRSPAPAILEYLPYRKDDVTADDDATRHPYFAEHGFAAVRVDLRGTGDSDGILLGEYLKQEQNDALEVIAWIAEQPWCTGAVGMFGYSWGGFNGLQVAARRPPALKAVVTAYSTDDRYRDDCHYMGGCLLASDMIKWATSMRGYLALPPDPRIRRDWRDVWLKRLEHTPPFALDWVSHQRRDEFWRHGSIAEDYSAIQAPTLVVGGWADAYTNAVPRLLEHLTCERRGIVGPWGHFLPYLPGRPGPAIGFLQECVRWFGRWLADLPTGVEADPFLRVYLQQGVAPQSTYRERAGEWLAIDSWPPGEAATMTWRLDADSRLRPTAQCPDRESTVEISSPQQTGRDAGVWCANGRDGELAEDQRRDDDLSATFDSDPLTAPLNVLGTPLLRMTVSADRPLALVAVRLCDVAPDGASTLVSWGLLNLARREDDDSTVPLEPGRAHEIEVALNITGYRFPVGDRVRVSVSPTYWPHAWPSPEPVTLVVSVGGPSLLDLPLPGESRPMMRQFDEPESSPHADPAALSARTRTRGASADGRIHTIADRETAHVTLPPAGTEFDAVSEDHYEIAADDPLSAKTRSVREWSLGREGWRIRIVADATMTSDAGSFHVDDLLRAYEDDQLVFEHHRCFDIPRDGV